MRGLVELFSRVGRAGAMALRSVLCFPSVFCRSSARHDLMRRLYATGIRTLPVLTFVSLFTGMILSLQVGLELSRFNQEMFLGAAVMVTLLREVAAFSSGICLAACVGSAIAAELGTMRVNDEIDALTVMGIDPVRFLAAPRVLALVIMAPLLAFYCCIAGMIGGGIVGHTQLGIGFGPYMSSALSMAATKDLVTGLVKAAVFGLLIGQIAVHEGFEADLGAMGVGRATQRTVIVSFLSILLFGYMITRVCYR